MVEASLNTYALMSVFLDEIKASFFTLLNKFSAFMYQICLTIAGVVLLFYISPIISTLIFSILLMRTIATNSSTKTEDEVIDKKESKWKIVKNYVNMTYSTLSKFTKLEAEADTSSKAPIKKTNDVLYTNYSEISICYLIQFLYSIIKILYHQLDKSNTTQSIKQIVKEIFSLLLYTFALIFYKYSTETNKNDSMIMYILIIFIVIWISRTYYILYAKIFGRKCKNINYYIDLLLTTKNTYINEIMISIILGIVTLQIITNEIV
jgi:hypothetical protein